MPRSPEDIFNEARLVEDAARRSAFLDEACQGDADLRARIEALLAADADAHGFLATAAQGATTEPVSPITERAGSQVGPYKILQQIGEGGFGTVFLAEQSKPIRRRIALKIIKLGMDTKQVIARFEAERQALALMDHPNIARVLDAGATDTGRPYFVMEYVVGDSITEFADAHKLSVRDRLELFNQACSAVQHAHTKGIIHRDIKPSNILVNMTDGRPFAKVIDFGIAKATAAPLTDKTLFTEHHQLIGTLEYMSPEQAEGLPDIDTRTDVYALGVLLYELLTGQTPIDGKRLRSAAWNEMRRIIKEEEPPAPSMRLSRDINKLTKIASARQAEPSKLGAILKGELDWIAIKALDKDRARRYETPSALAADVQRHLDGDAVVAAPVSRLYKVRKFVRRNKGLVMASGAVSAALLVGVAGTTWQWNIAATANNKLRSQATRARSGVGEMMSILSDGILGGMPDSINPDTGRSEFEEDPLEASVGFGIQLAESLKEERDNLVEQTDTAEWSSYTANLALAQMAMDNGNWPEARARIAACPESKRGWEWEFLSNKAESVIAEFGGIGSTASPDAKYFLTWDGKSAQIYNANVEAVSDKIVNARWVNPTASRINVFSPDGSRCIVNVDPMAMQIFVRENNRYVPEQGTPIPGHIQALNRDATRLVALTFVDEETRLYDESGSLIAILDNSAMLGGRYAHIQISPDSSLIAGANQRGGVQLWKANGTPLRRMESDTPFFKVIFSSDGESIAGLSHKRVFVWDINGDLISDTIAHDALFSGLWYSGDGSTFVTSDVDGSVMNWTFEGNSASKPMEHQSIVRDVLFSPDRRIILTVDDFNIVRFWDENGQFLGSQIPHEKWNGTPLYSPDAQYLVTSKNGQLRIWNEERKLVSIFETPGHSGMFEYSDSIRAIAFTDDGQSLVYSYGSYMEGPAKGIRVTPFPWSSSTRSFDSQDHIYGTSISYAITELRISAELYDPSTPVAPVNESAYWFDDPQTIIATHPDGSRIVTAAGDNTVRFWDTETEKQLAAIPMDAGVTNLTITPDGTRLVIELDDGSARIFDTRSAEEQAADVQRRWAERVPAGAYLDTLMAGPTPTDELMAIIETDRSLTPLRRLAAAEVFTERLADLTHQADRAFKEITKDQTDKAIVLTAASAADLPMRVKEMVLAKAEAWVYTPPNLTIEEKKQRLAKAGFIVDRLVGTESPYVGNNRPELVEAVEARIDLFGPDHPESMVASWVLGAMDFKEGRKEAGLERMRATAKRYERWAPYDDDDYLLIAMYDNLIQAELITGHIEGAEVWLDKLIQTLENLIEDDPELRGNVVPRGFGVSSVGFLPLAIKLDYRLNYKLPESEKTRTSLESHQRIIKGLQEVQQVGLRETALLQNSQKYSISNRTKDGTKYLQVNFGWANEMLAQLVVEAFPNDQRSQRPFALASYREGEYQAALNAITLAAEYRAATPMDESSPHPYDAAILAMSHFQLAQQLAEADPALGEHLAAASQALENCRTIMTNPEALNDNGQSWAEDPIAQSLLTEAEALIGGHEK